MVRAGNAQAVSVRKQVTRTMVKGIRRHLPFHSAIFPSRLNAFPGSRAGESSVADGFDPRGCRPQSVKGHRAISRCVLEELARRVESESRNASGSFHDWQWKYSYKNAENLYDFVFFTHFHSSRRSVYPQRRAGVSTKL